jgi:hypothetical protein
LHSFFDKDLIRKGLVREIILSVSQVIGTESLKARGQPASKSGFGCDEGNSLRELIKLSNGWQN